MARDIIQEMEDALPALALQALRIIGGKERVLGRDSWAIRVISEAASKGLLGLTARGMEVYARGR